VRFRRRDDRLSYDVPRPLGIEAVTEAFVGMTGRASVATWGRRCEASLRASRRRRGLPVGGEDIVVRLRFEDRATPSLAAVAEELRRIEASR
jgi:hypothetical protein